MKANTKLTALEILTAAGFEKPEEKIGKVRCRIAGIRGIVRPDHLINLQPGLEKIEVVLGQETKEVELDGQVEVREFSAGAKAALKEKGKRATELVKKIQDAKKIKSLENLIDDEVENVKSGKTKVLEE